MTSVNQCWCGSAALDVFSKYYYKCKECNTLICKFRMSDEFYKGGDDPGNFYGKNYWTNFLTKEYGYPDIVQLSRIYLAERCIYWLRNILKYKLTPAKTLELGCAHGGLVFLMKLAGYDAAGSEMSQWLCDYAHNTFDITMMCDRIEDLNVSDGSYDAILLMDVIEHLTDPVAGLKRIARSLKDDGIAVIQTPCWRETDKTYEEMKNGKSIFIEQFKEKEHLYLFNEASIKRILNETGFPHIAFEPSIFSYDMFIFAGKRPLNKIEQDVIDNELQKTPKRRIALALLDVYDQSERKNKLLSDCEADRAARLVVIEEQAKQFAERLAEAETEKAAKLEVMENQAKQLAGRLADAETENAAKLEIIENQAKELEAFRGSLSWKLTAPGRWVLDRLGKLK
jgi:2-polyprenyl-3-methyl-5-hydroxy-6-metoxy-1,4-benzoquinol methylase